MNYILKNINANEILLYLRKSRKDYEFINEEIEKTLERHEKILQDFSLKTFKSSIPEENILREVVSGDTIIDRPEMQKVLALIEQQKYKAVLVLEIERLARGNTIDQGVIAQTFQYTNTLIITPQKIFNLEDDMDRSFFEDGLYQSRKYLLYTKKILSRGRIQSVSEGKAVMSITAFGYAKEKLKNEKGFILTINESEASIVRLIFHKFLNENLGTSKIADYLNSINAKARKSKIWTPAMIRNILSNITIAGKITWNHRKTITLIENGKIRKSKPVNNECIIVDGLHDAIIDYNDCIKAQNKLKRLHRIKAPSIIKNPLAGLVYCKVCGHSMIRRPYKNSSKDVIMCPLPHCKNISSNLEILENKILRELYKIIQHYNKYTNRTVKENFKNYDSLINNLNNEIDSLKNQYKKACEMLEKGVYGINDFKERKKFINDEIDSKNKAIQKLLDEQNKEEINKYKVLIPKIESAIKLYNSKLTPKEKNELLKSLIKKIDYLKIVNCRWDKDKLDEFSIQIELKI